MGFEGAGHAVSNVCREFLRHIPNDPQWTRIADPKLQAIPKFGIACRMASKNTSIALGAPFTEFAKRKVDSGEFGSTSEVVREAMRQYIAQDARREALDRALKEGLDSGIAEDFDWDEFMERKFGPDDA
jgi:antitoxin ParD1/3/4